MNILRRLAAALARLLDHWVAETFEVPTVPALPPGVVEVIAERPIVEGQVVTASDVSPAPPRAAGPPYFVCDFSHWDGAVDVDAFLADRRYVGVWVKLTQGTRGYDHERYGVDLALRLIRAARAAGRLGVDFFVGGYHYLSFDADGARQATYLFKQHRAAGILDVPPAARLRAMMDVERGSAKSANYDDTGIEVTTCALDFSRQWLALTGTRPVAYGRGAWRDLKLRGLLGCDGLVNPAYTRDMPPMDAYGVPRSAVVAQQYTDGEVNRTTFPTLPPGAKAADTSVLLGPARGQLADLAMARARLVWKP